MTRMTLRLVLLSGLAAGPAWAQAPAPAMTCSQHCEMMAKAANTTMAQATPPATPSMTHGNMPMSANHMEMMQRMEAMNKAMTGAPMTDDPERALVNMMLPHHQGAIDMARIYLREGKDPEIRRMAEKIIADQQREISEFQAWLAKNPAPAR